VNNYANVLSIRKYIDKKWAYYYLFLGKNGKHDSFHMFKALSKGKFKYELSSQDQQPWGWDINAEYTTYTLEDFKYIGAIEKYCYLALHEFHNRLRLKETPALVKGMEMVISILVNRHVTPNQVKFLNASYPTLKEKLNA